MIEITGKDIIEYDGQDHTGALKELGIKFIPKTEKLDESICNLKFKVSLNFILRHGLLNEKIYKKYYKKSTEYKKYYNEGKLAFLSGKEEDNPYDTGTIADKDYWTNSIYYKRYPWYDGYRETGDAKYWKKYKLDNFQNEIKTIVKKYKLKIKYADEYDSPYLETPEGYIVEFA